jgi:hypothetical protein
MAPNVSNLIGKRYGRLVVCSYSGNSRWACICDCGNETTVRTDKLNRCHTTSCGCRKRETAAERCTTHGLSKSPTYKVWATMLNRCRNPNVKSFRCYGGRGVSVCERWTVFENFFADMGHAPKGNHIDRINNSGDYEPGNCEWVTPKHNQNNKRSNRLVEWGSQTKTVSQWATEVGIAPHTLWMRLFNCGWHVEKAMTKPVRSRNT